MFKFNELTHIHLEISSRCQASCPMCPRNIHGGIDNPNLKVNDWTYNDFISIFSKEVTDQLEFITFCGTFGEPIMNNDLIDMCQYLKVNAPHVIVKINTNGSARSTTWWKKLAKSLPESHHVTFALDGLLDTHHLYRIGTSFEKIIENASAFISAGGIAEWMFIRFKHNEHQVDEARELSKKIGFKEFILKDTRRFQNSNFKVLNKDGSFSHNLEPPSNVITKPVPKISLENYQSWDNADKINCFVFNRKEIYIDANFTVLPCCILAAFLYTNYDKSILIENNLYDETSVNDVGLNTQKQLYEIIDELGGLESLNSKKIGIKNIIDTNEWQTIWKNKWNTKKSAACILLCSLKSPYVSVYDQYVK